MCTVAKRMGMVRPVETLALLQNRFEARAGFVHAPLSQIEARDFTKKGQPRTVTVAIARFERIDPGLEHVSLTRGIKRVVFLVRHMGSIPVQRKTRQSCARIEA